MIIDDVVEAIFQRLCIRHRYGGTDVDRSMSFTELRIALGITDAEMKEALWVLGLPGDKRIAYPSKDHVALGTDWLGRCERQTTRKEE